LLVATAIAKIAASLVFLCVSAASWQSPRHDGLVHAFLKFLLRLRRVALSLMAVRLVQLELKICTGFFF
jgi:hypothetical protein